MRSDTVYDQKLDSKVIELMKEQDPNVRKTFDAIVKFSETVAASHGDSYVTRSLQCYMAAKAINSKSI